MGGLDGVQPLICRHLVRADYLADFIIQDLGGGAGEGRQSGVPELAQEVGNAQAQGRRTLADLKWGKSMDMNAGDGSLNGAAVVDVGAPRILRIDSALQA